MGIPNMREARVIQVIETRTCEGNGTKDDITREVIRYWSLDGKLLAVNDPMKRGGE